MHRLAICTLRLLTFHRIAVASRYRFLTTLPLARARPCRNDVKSPFRGHRFHTRGDLATKVAGNEEDAFVTYTPLRGYWLSTANSAHRISSEGTAGCESSEQGYCETNRVS